MKWNTPHEFFLDTVGKINGGGQCVQLFNFFNGKQINKQFYCPITGYAKDIWNNRHNSGILEYYEEVPINNMIDGDWVIYDNCEFAPYSHIAMFRKDNNDGTGIFLQSNDKRHNPVLSTNQDDNPYVGIMGALRLKNWYNPYKTYIKYCGHVQNKGWLPYVENGEIAGTTGQSLRMEAIKIDSNLEIKAKAHLQDIGDVDYGKINKDTIIGTTAESRRLEALCLEGNFTYRVHIENLGWTDWHKADGKTWLGTKGKALRMEAIEILK